MSTLLSTRLDKGSLYSVPVAIGDQPSLHVITAFTIPDIMASNLIEVSSGDEIESESEAKANPGAENPHETVDLEDKREEKEEEDVHDQRNDARSGDEGTLNSTIWLLVAFRRRGRRLSTVLSILSSNVFLRPCLLIKKLDVLHKDYIPHLLE